MIIDGKVVLITGASGGIGAACVSAFRDRGAAVVLTGRSVEKLAAVARPGELTLPADLTLHDDRIAVISKTLAHHGRIDILVNNAGAGLYIPSHLAPLAESREMFELNFFAPLHLIQLAAAEMKKRRSGAIVNVSSIAGKVTLPWFTLYSATKHALVSLTEGLRTELKRDGIHCMSVCPGYVKTRFQANVLGGRVPKALTGLPRRWATTPERCAEAMMRGLERGAATVVTPATGWLFIGLNQILPGVVGRVMESMYFGQESEA
jgi:short-subunit dehydrogenase